MRDVLCRVAVVVGLLAFAGAAHARDLYGAIAYSPSTGAHGYSFDYGSRASAERKALSSCRKYARDCRVPLWFRNSCGALAVGNGGGWGTAWGPNRAAAEANALRSCRGHTKGCGVVRWVCTGR